MFNSKCILFVVALACSSCVLYAQGQNRYIRTMTNKCEDIKLIVDYHNDVRRQLANGTKLNEPKAANMQQMVWDRKLAKLASAYSKNMLPIHNPYRNDSRYEVGENIFMTTSTNLKNLRVEWIRALNGWHGESARYTYQITKSNNITGHYQQMIWWDTIHVGCGTTQFLYNNISIGKLYVCNYGPTGNWEDTYPYQADTAIEEYRMMIKNKWIPSDTPPPPTFCDNLCCNFTQCARPYGRKCSERPPNPCCPTKP